MMDILIPIVTAFLDRWGGGGFPFKFLPQKGFKFARRGLLPAFLWAVGPHDLPRAIFCALMGIILSYNLDEIEQRDWEEVMLHGFGLAFCLWTVSGWWSMLVPAWWLFGVYWSNIGIGFRNRPAIATKTGREWTANMGGKIDWFWVELIRGFLIGLAVVL